MKNKSRTKKYKKSHRNGNAKKQNHINIYICAFTAGFVWMRFKKARHLASGNIIMLLCAFRRRV